MKELEIPSSVKEISYNAFEYCNSLTFYEYDNALYLGNKENHYHALIKIKSQDITTCKINDSCKVIADGAFTDCKYLKEVSIPEGVYKIGGRTFEGCNNLEFIKIPNSVTGIGINAFKDCYSLKNIVIPENVEYIYEKAFESCRNLENITILSSNIRLSELLFLGCWNLKSITCEAKTPPSCENFGIDVNKVILYVPKESVELYESSKEYWPYIRNIVGK